MSVRHFVPSTYQLAIFDWIENTVESTCVVEACAGSGKTTLLVEGARLLSKIAPQLSALFLAFSREIKDTLEGKLEGTGMKASTIHGLGYGAISYAMSRAKRGKVELDEGKYRKVVKGWKAEFDAACKLDGVSLTSAEVMALQDTGGWTRFAGAVLSLFGLCRLSLVSLVRRERGGTLTACVDARGVDQMARKHQVDMDPSVRGLVHRALGLLARYGLLNPLTIDYGDMVWMPVVMRYYPRTYAWIFVDECQDLSAASLELALMARGKNGRMIFVGDRKQAIFGFAGADADSFVNIIARTNARVLPLSICYRCPTSVLDLAREYCPQIEARENAPEGIVREIERGQFCAQVDDGDMVLCRLTAPLIGACFELLANGIPAVVRGREIAEGLVVIIEKIGESWQFEEFGEGVAGWLAERSAYARRRHEDEDRAQAEIDQVSDQAECLRIIWARAGARPNPSFASMIADLRAMFSDKTRATVVLSTIHRAKGLENPRVFVLHPDRIRSPRARAAWQLEQEYNLAYVCLTRAQQELVFVEEPAKRAA